MIFPLFGFFTFKKNLFFEEIYHKNFIKNFFFKRKNDNKTHKQTLSIAHDSPEKFQSNIKESTPGFNPKEPN